MDEQLHLLTGAYALNALDEDERAVFEAHAAATESSRSEVRELSETAAMLAYGTPAVVPPPELKSRVMASIKNTRQLPSEAVVRDIADARSRKSRRSPVLLLASAAAALLVATAGLGGLAVSLQNERNQAQQQLSALAQQQAAVLQIFSADDAKVEPARMNGAVVTIGYSPKLDKAAVITHNLPKLDEDKAYELWFISDAGARPAGLIQKDAPGEITWTVLEGEPTGATHVGITVEPAGGSAQPTTEPIMVEPLA